LALPLHRIPHQQLITRCWELRQNLTPYDAAYVALAELLDAVLVIGDKRLSRSPSLRCRVQVIG
jgi:predicted nucleic acid-binding protein